MNDKQEYTNQHYIPQCYLKLFSSGGKSVYVKDSQTSPSETKDIKNICCEDDLYSIQTKRIGRFVILENQLQNEVENPYSKLLKEITKRWKRVQTEKLPDKQVLTEDERFLFAAFISIQYIRLPKFKNYFVRLADETSPMQSVFGTKYAEMKGDDIILNTYPDVSPSLLHANFGYNNMDIVTKYAQKISRDYWEFLYTNSKKVCTSNNPICFGDCSKTYDVVPFAQDDTAKFIALSNCYEDWVELPYDNLIKYETYLGFPISRNIYLRVWNKENYPEKYNVNNRFSKLPDEMLDELNDKTLRNSTEIYSLLPFEDVFSNGINNK